MQAGTSALWCCEPRAACFAWDAKGSGKVCRAPGTRNSAAEAGGDPKHFFDALAMSERDDRKAFVGKRVVGAAFLRWSLQAAIGFMKFLFWFQSLPQFTVGLAQARAHCSYGMLLGKAPRQGLCHGQRDRPAVRMLGAWAQEELGFWRVGACRKEMS